MQSSMPATGGTGWRVAVPLDTLSRHAPAKTLLDTTAHAQPEPFLSGEALAEVEATGVQCPLGAGLTSAAVGAPPPGGWYLGHCSCQPWRGELARGLQLGGELCPLWGWGEGEGPGGGSTPGSGTTSSPGLSEGTWVTCSTRQKCPQPRGPGLCSLPANELCKTKRHHPGPQTSPGGAGVSQATSAEPPVLGSRG